MTVHHTLVALCLALGLTMLCPIIALATTDLPIYGGLGGQEYRADCPTGSYLVGLAGRTGSWVDSIAPICAPWLVAKQVFGPPAVGPSYGAGTGGQEGHPICWNEFVGSIFVVQSWKIDVLRSDNHYVQRIRAHCASVPPSAKSMSLYFGAKDPHDQTVSFGPFGTKPPEQACPAQEVAVGIRVRAGQFVDAIGLICGPFPLGPSAPVTKLPGPLVQAPPPARPFSPRTKNLMIPDDMFVITRPVPGDRVSQGQLIIVATGPKVGSTNVAELELKYLDAPPNQANAYPYTTVVAVDTASLLQGYSVAPIVTGYNGRWQVRARSSMKSVPGTWSLPIEFHLIATQPMPLQQQAPLFGSSLMRPQSPDAGIMPGMAPPPSPSKGMIRPRGIQPEELPRSNQTADPAIQSKERPWPAPVMRDN